MIVSASIEGAFWVPLEVGQYERDGKVYYYYMVESTQKEAGRASGPPRSPVHGL
jgi:hypothetical protein